MWIRASWFGHAGVAEPAWCLIDHPRTIKIVTPLPVSRNYRTICLALLAALCTATVFAQQPFETEAVAPQRFLAVHGRKAVIMGYASSGLEAWTYPLQLITGYELTFRPTGQTTEVAGATLLRRITYEPQAVTRTYIGPDFILHERLFVPLDQQAILITYTVECRHSIDITIHFTSVLDLMWPYALGGQSTQWDNNASAYILTDGRRQYTAMIGTPDVTSHDEILNTIQPGALGSRLALTVRAGGEAHPSATLVMAQLSTGTAPAEQIKSLLLPGAEAEAADHYTRVAAEALHITTPDPAVNQQLAWAQAALDQAWVCNPTLGCGMVAGYGPSRPGRRPQYDWFFAGDALIATEALLNTANYQRAQRRLAFIAKYQDSATGMIWHEISQSANPADWATQYPYMFVHVDITFQYLIAVDHYVTASGDTQFLKDHWAGIAAAYRYCASLLNPADGLPRIPANKEGGNEQDKITDDLDLSVSWVNASAAFRHLAQLSGHPEQAEQARQASEQAARAAATHYWSETRHTWIDGYNEAGAPILRGGDDGIRLITSHLLDPQRSNAVLDHLASADFQSDWGTRGVPTTSPQYDPTSYSKGSVSAAGTAGIAAAYWSQHRPVTAFAIWSALLPWGTLDSMGHMHELVAGDFYHQQAESVPEQTWSSAAFLSSTVHGLLGLQRNAESNQLEFSPHLPPNWNELAVDHIKVANGSAALEIRRVSGGLDLHGENSGKPLDLTFSPEIPLGAHGLQAEWNNQSIPVHKEDHAQDSHATLHISLPTGSSHGHLRYTGGVLVSVSEPAPQVGEASNGIKITAVSWQGSTLSISADVPRISPPGAGILLWSAQAPLAMRGGTFAPLSAGVYRLAITPEAAPHERTPEQNHAYRHAEVTVSFAQAPAR